MWPINETHKKLQAEKKLKQLKKPTNLESDICRRKIYHYCGPFVPKSSWLGETKSPYNSYGDQLDDGFFILTGEDKVNKY